MFHRILFLLFIVCSVSCNFVKSLCRLFSVQQKHQEYSKCQAYQTLLKITHNKTIKWRIKIINSLLCCSNTQQLALQIWGLSKVRTEWLYRRFWKFFIVFAESPLLPCIQHRSRLFLLNSPDIMEEFSSWKRFIIRSIPQFVLRRKRVLRSSWLLNEYNLSYKILKNRILSEVRKLTKKTPHSIVCHRCD